MWVRNTFSETVAPTRLSPEHQLVIRSDNGPQMSVRFFYEHLKKVDIKLSHEFIPPNTPNKNTHLESSFSLLEIEFFQTRYFNSLEEAYR
jgi:putative transposase